MTSYQDPGTPARYFQISTSFDHPRSPAEEVLFFPIFTIKETEGSVTCPRSHLGKLRTGIWTSFWVTSKPIVLLPRFPASNVYRGHERAFWRAVRRLVCWQVRARCRCWEMNLKRSPEARWSGASYDAPTSGAFNRDRRETP